MTLLAVRPGLPQPDIGAVLDALAHHRRVEFDCSVSPAATDTIEVRSRHDLEERLIELFPFRAHMEPVSDEMRIGTTIILHSGLPIFGEGENLAAAIDDLVVKALDYIERWEHHLRFSATHQRYWGWVYRLLLAGDNDHIRATLLNQSR